MSILFTPIELGRVQVKNRFIHSAKRWSGLFEHQKGFLSDKLLLFKTLAATLLPVISKMSALMKMYDFKRKS